MFQRLARRDLLRIILVIFYFPASALGEDAPLNPTSKDAMYAHDRPIISCSYPIKHPSCKGLCVDMKIRYDEMDHVNGRDADPKRALAKAERLDLDGIKKTKIEVPFAGGAIPTYEVGDIENKNCKWATIWVHGATPQKGDLGVTDNIFGGAFNRMQQMAVRNDGLYYSPSLGDFGSEGVKGLAAIVKRIRQKTCPKGKIILNCGSAGTHTCWQLADDPEAVKDLSGLVMIGSGSGPQGGLLNSKAVAAGIPVLFTQGERDNPEPFREMANKLREKRPDYPIRFVMFATAGHMQPLRMLDWRETMNCMLSQAPEPAPSGSRNAPDQRSSQGAKVVP